MKQNIHFYLLLLQMYLSIICKYHSRNHITQRIIYVSTFIFSSQHFWKNYIQVINLIIIFYFISVINIIIFYGSNLEHIILKLIEEYIMGCSQSTSLNSAITSESSMQTVDQVKSMLRQQISSKTIYQIDFDITKLLDILYLNEKTQVSQEYLKKILEIAMDYISFCKNKFNKNQHLPVKFTKYAEERRITYKEGIAQLCQKIKREILIKKQKLKTPKLTKITDQPFSICKTQPSNALDILEEFKKKNQKGQKTSNKINTYGMNKNDQIIDQIDKITSDNQKVKKYQSKKLQREKQNRSVLEQDYSLANSKAKPFDPYQYSANAFLPEYKKTNFTPKRQLLQSHIEEEVIKPIGGLHLAPLNPFKIEQKEQNSKKINPIAFKRQIKDKKSNQQNLFNWEDKNPNPFSPKIQEKQKAKIAPFTIATKNSSKSPINVQKSYLKQQNNGMAEQNSPKVAQRPTEFQDKVTNKTIEKGFVSLANNKKSRTDVTEVIEDRDIQQEIQENYNKANKSNNANPKKQSLRQSIQEECIYQPSNNKNSRLVHHQVKDQAKIIPQKLDFDKNKQKITNNKEYQFDFDEKKVQGKKEIILQTKKLQISPKVQQNQQQQDEYAESFQDFNGNTEKTLGFQPKSNDKKDFKTNVQRTSKRKETKQVACIKNKDSSKIPQVSKKDDEINQQDTKKPDVPTAKPFQQKLKMNSVKSKDQFQNSLTTVQQPLQIKLQPKDESALPRIGNQKQKAPIKVDDTKKNLSQKAPIKEQKSLQKKNSVVNSKKEINIEKNISRNSNNNIKINDKVQVDEKKALKNVIKKEQKQVASKPNLLVKKTQNKPKLTKKQTNTVNDNKIISTKEKTPLTPNTIIQKQDDSFKVKQTEKYISNQKVKEKVEEYNLISQKTKIHDIQRVTQVKKQKQFQQPKQTHKKSQPTKPTKPDFIDQLLNSQNDATLDQKLLILGQEMKSNKIYHKDFDIKLLLSVINLSQTTYVPDQNKKQIIFVALDYASYCKNKANRNENLSIKLEQYAQSKNISYLEGIAQMCEKIQADIDQLNGCDDDF